MTTVEKITTPVSILAFLMSGLSLYIQVFYVSESIKAAVIHLDITNHQEIGTIALDLALINGGNRDTLIPECHVKSDNLAFNLETPAEPQVILKPNEIKPRTIRGTFTVNHDAVNGTTPIALFCNIIGPHGNPRDPSAPIAILMMQDGKITEDHLLPIPVRLQ
jgi:hypothetical protein